MYKYKNYVIKWSHFRYNDEYPSINGVKRILSPKGGSTSCSILLEGNEIAHAVSVCHRNDNFNKEFGRIQSLKRALPKAITSKAERTEFWRTFFNLGRVFEML